MTTPLDASDDEEDETAEDPPTTEEPRLTTEESVPEAAIGQIFVKTLTGNTIISPQRQI